MKSRRLARVLGVAAFMGAAALLGDGVLGVGNVTTVSASFLSD